MVEHVWGEEPYRNGLSFEIVAVEGEVGDLKRECIMLRICD